MDFLKFLSLNTGLTSSIPNSCNQLLTVAAPDINSTQAHLWLLERPHHTAPWQASFGPIPVSLGRNGLAWAHHSPSPPNIPSKKEGDQRAPIGVFELPYAFGSSHTTSTKLPYHLMTPHHAGVDDPNSRYYNQVIDSRKVVKDWQSAENMLPNGGSYELGIFVAHNPTNQPNAGSCIFIHLWQSPNHPTSGCTAMSKPHLQQLLQTLHPNANPHLIQYPEKL